VVQLSELKNKLINLFSYSEGKLDPFYKGDKEIVFNEVIKKKSKGEVEFAIEEIECEECGYKHPHYDMDRAEVYCPKCGLVNIEKVEGDYGQYLYSPWFGTRKIIQKIKYFDFGRFKDPKYVEWRKEVISKAKGKCLKCKERGTHCHHILNYSQYPSLQLDVDNGVLLCSSCHELFHIIYGKQDNNERQLNNFLKTDFKGGFHGSKGLGTKAQEI
jgi:Zn finger protein HypA/HybF involved in hydrogenase expression